MKLIKCNNGHFYDGDKHSSCPHCSENSEQNSNAAGKEKVNNSQDGFTIDIVNAEDPVYAPEKKENVNPVISTLDISSQPVSKNDDEVTVGLYDVRLNENAVKAANIVEKKKSGFCAGWLLCIKGVNKGIDYRVTVGRNSIGRNESNDIPLCGESSVSREAHAYIVYEPQNNKFYVLPGLSRSLVYVNGDVLLEKKEIEKHGYIELGETQLMLIPACDEKFQWKML